MGTKTVVAEIRTDKSFEEVKVATRETFRTLGGVIQDTPYGFQIDGGTSGINFGFVATIKAAVAIRQQQAGLYRIESVIVWSPNALVWICLTVGWFVFGILELVAALYLFVDPAPVYSRLLTQVERLLNSNVSAPQILPAAASAPALPQQDDFQQRLKRLQEMRDGGLITPEDYEAKKTEILARL